MLQVFKNGENISERKYTYYARNSKIVGLIYHVFSTLLIQITYTLLFNLLVLSTLFVLIKVIF